jgi:RimJ/RimL family protein N-acetyltransferase
MMKVETLLREATLLDTLGVISQMNDTARGQAELKQARLLDGPYTDEQLAVRLWGTSQAAFAMTTFDQPGRALVVAGFIPQRIGVLQTWMLATDEAWEHYGADVTAHTAEGIKKALDRAHRIQAICLNSHEQAHRWYARIGLQKETILTRYCTDGSDAAMFVLTRSEH